MYVEVQSGYYEILAIHLSKDSMVDSVLGWVDIYQTIYMEQQGDDMIDNLEALDRIQRELKFMHSEDDIKPLLEDIEILTGKKLIKISQNVQNYLYETLYNEIIRSGNNERTK